MLFNSYIFILLFLPVTLAGFFLIGRRGHHRIAISWLVAASLFFYGWWNPAYLGLMLGSILFNYAVGVALGNPDRKEGRTILVLGVVANLGLLGYFKYANFFVDNINWIFGSSFTLETIILPLAISFFTFQQIAYLVDAYRGETREYNFLHYCLFVTFFPQLIAGPIVHHKEMLPQFGKDSIYRLNYSNLAIGITIFTLGLFKKVIIADGVAEYSTPVFDASESGMALTFFEAWGASMAFTLQIYFDFSGYSDMAIGLGRMFGVRLPLNFHSPFKAVNMIDLWRRWHMTLTRFLRDYLYFPLGGNRKGLLRRDVNMMITMLLGGLWHGAAWTFVIWGGMHGLFLAINQRWHKLRLALGHDLERPTWYGREAARLLTFIMFVFGAAFFRSESFAGAMNMVWSMVGGNGLSLPMSLSRLVPGAGASLAHYGIVFQGMFSNYIVPWSEGMPLLVSSLLLAFYAPNTQQYMIDAQPAFGITRGKIDECWGGMLEWKISLPHAMAIALILFYTIANLIKESEFLYFNF